MNKSAFVAVSLFLPQTVASTFLINVVVFLLTVVQGVQAWPVGSQDERGQLISTEIPSAVLHRSLLKL